MCSGCYGTKSVGHGDGEIPHGRAARGTQDLHVLSLPHGIIDGKPSSWVEPSGTAAHSDDKDIVDSPHLNHAVQPALFVAGLAAVEKLRQEDPEAVAGCSAAAGLSLGEYTALVFAGALSFEDGLKVRLSPLCPAIWGTRS